MATNGVPLIGVRLLTSPSPIADDSDWKSNPRHGLKVQPILRDLTLNIKQVHRNLR